MKRTCIGIISIIAFAISLIACDPEHRKKCEWYLMPDPDRAKTSNIHEGYIPVCARNLVVNKEDCRLQAKLDFAEKAYNKKFRYVDIKIDDIAVPQSIADIEFCQ